MNSSKKILLNQFYFYDNLKNKYLSSTIIFRIGISTIEYNSNVIRKIDKIGFYNEIEISLKYYGKL